MGRWSQAGRLARANLAGDGMSTGDLGYVHRGVKRAPFESGFLVSRICRFGKNGCISGLVLSIIRLRGAGRFD